VHKALAFYKLQAFAFSTQNQHQMQIIFASTMDELQLSMDKKAFYSKQ